MSASREDLPPTYVTQSKVGHHVRSSDVQLGTVLFGAAIKTGPDNKPSARAPSQNAAVWMVFPKPIWSPRIALWPSASLFRSQRTPSRWYGCRVREVGAGSEDPVAAAAAAAAFKCAALAPTPANDPEPPPRNRGSKSWKRTPVSAKSLLRVVAGGGRAILALYARSSAVSRPATPWFARASSAAPKANSRALASSSAARAAAAAARGDSAPRAPSPSPSRFFREPSRKLPLGSHVHSSYGRPHHLTSTASRSSLSSTTRSGMTCSNAARSRGASGSVSDAPVRFQCPRSLCDSLCRIAHRGTQRARR